MKSPTNLVLILLAIGLFFAFTSPVYEDVKVLQASANDYRSVIKNVSNIAETRDALLVNYEAIPKNEIDRLSKVLPDNVDSVRLALDLDTMAGRYDIALKDVQVESKADPNSALAVLPSDATYEKVIVTFSFISTFQNFMSLLADLEKSLRIMDVKSVSFKTNEAGFYEHQMKVETYWLK